MNPIHRWINDLERFYKEEELIGSSGKYQIMKKIKITFYISLEDYALLKAIMIKRMIKSNLPKVSHIICEAIRNLAKE